MNPGHAVAHLRTETWARANRLLVGKALAEFSHERLLIPELIPAADRDQTGRPDRYVVRSDDGGVEYRFEASVLALDHWQIEVDSIVRQRGGAELPLDAVDFCLELRDSLGLTEQVLPVYLEEIAATLSSSAYKLTKPHISAAELATADYQAIETGMTEGHPVFVANNGRIGFGIDEYHAYAPEAASPVQLTWLAAHRDHCTFTCSTDIDYDRLIAAELGEAVLSRFSAIMTGQQLDLADYYLLPVHPWQWQNKLSVTFAAEIAQQRLVWLGSGDDSYLAQQSIRTFFNTSSPAKHYVKTALSVLNMGFMRGLSAAYMDRTPAINDWLAELVAKDDVLQAAGLTIIRERAAIGYHHRQYEAATTATSPYRRMLAALWRESPVPALDPGQRLATMACLLHTDADGGSVAAALIEQSGLPPVVWLRRYLDAYLTPLLHCFYAHDLAFMPHGENVILVLDGGTVERTIFKDIGEEIMVMDPAAELPAGLERIRTELPDHVKALTIFTDVFDCFFRYLSAILHTGGVLDEEEFWRTVAECVADYRASAGHLAEKFERFDPFADEFALSCLNRLQLRDNQAMLDLSDPAAALQLVGRVVNPIARFAGTF